MAITNYITCRGGIMNNPIDWEKFENPFFKFEPGKEYIVSFENWRQEMKTYGKESKDAVISLVMDITVVSYDGKERVFRPPKEFSTTNRSFIEAIKEYIFRAEQEHRQTLVFNLKKNHRGVYQLYPFRF